ncbi:MAG: DUF2752 domain-containing protein [Lachnospiraceae bacterium]|nr:DUF2752 domain-containing protein [Lachnospiraceae bacterium]
MVQYFIGYACPLLKYTGFSCPGCGLTRAWRCFLTGNLKQALYWHPLFLLPVPTVIIMLMEDRIPGKIYTVIMSLIAAVFIIVYIMRMAAGDPVLEHDFHNGLIWQRFVQIRDFIKGFTG